MDLVRNSLERVSNAYEKFRGDVSFGTCVILGVLDQGDGDWERAFKNRAHVIKRIYTDDYEPASLPQGVETEEQLDEYCYARIHHDWRTRFRDQNKVKERFTYPPETDVFIDYAREHPIPAR